jgi:hypothetical protein
LCPSKIEIKNRVFSLLVGGFFQVGELSGAGGELPDRSKPSKPARARQAALESDQFVCRSAPLRVDKRETFTAW